MSVTSLLRAERQFRLSLLSSRLDIAKARSLLHRSLDAHAATTRDPVFLSFLYQGKLLLLYALSRHFGPPPTSADPADPAASADAAAAAIHRGTASAKTTDLLGDPHSGFGQRSKVLGSVVKACVVDDVNLAAAFEALRLEELLEGCYDAPPVEFCAAIVLAILGELHVLRQTLLSDERKDVRPTVDFIERTLEHFVSLLIETGRDRYTYIKETLVSSILTPSRPCMIPEEGEERPPDARTLTDDSFILSDLLTEDFDWPSTLESGGGSLLSTLYNRGDVQLEILLASGTVLSLLRRLKLLQDTYGGDALNLIRFAVIRQGPLLNMLRQLTVTRLMYALACPLEKADAHERERASIRCASYLDAGRATLRIIAEALLDCGVSTWCYESDAERSAICCKGLSPHCGRRLSMVLCVKVSRTMLEWPASCELPEADVLSAHFFGMSDGGPRPPKYNQLFFSQQRQEHDRDWDAQGAPELRTSAYSLVASHLSRGTPDFFAAGALDDVRLFTSPLLMAIKDTRGFQKMLADFAIAKDIEEDPDKWSSVG